MHGPLVPRGRQGHEEAPEWREPLICLVPKAKAKGKGLAKRPRASPAAAETDEGTAVLGSKGPWRWPPRKKIIAVVDDDDIMDRELFYKGSEPAASAALPLAQTIKKQLLQYRALPEYQESGGCPLRWWRERAWQMPALALLARDCLGMPGSSHALERAFSHAGRGVDPRRRPRLAPQNACALIMAHENVRRDVA